MNKSNITPAQLQVFVTIAEVGSLTSAGQVLNLTQSGVSHALASLEKALGLTLFDRDRSGVTLTHAGSAMLLRARTALMEMNHLEQSAALLLGEMRGSLRIGAFPSVSTRYLPQLIHDFMAQFPEIDLTLTEGTDQEVTEWLKMQQIDVGFVALPNTQFNVFPFAEDEFLVLLPQTHRYAAVHQIALAEIADEPFIMSSGGCEPLINAIFTTAGYTPQTRFLLRDMNTILSFVEAGLGISVVPALAITSHQRKIAAVPLTPTVTRRIGIAVRSLESATPLVQQFMHFLTQTVSVNQRIMT